MIKSVINPYLIYGDTIKERLGIGSDKDQSAMAKIDRLANPRIGLDDFIVPKEVYAEKMNLNQELVQKAAQKVACINEKNAEQALIEHQAKKIERYKLDTGRALRDLKAGNIDQAVKYLEALQYG